MYYIVCLFVYLGFIYWFISCFKKPSKKEKNKFKNVFLKESIKGLTKSDVKYRKNRVSVLSLWQRFLYWLWVWSVFALIFAPVILFNFARVYIIETFFIPIDALHFEVSSLSNLIFWIGSFLCGISICVVYSYITNRGVIRKADLLYQMGSFQEYPKEANILICGILLIIGLPIMFISFNSYKYITREEVVVKSAFSINSKEYEYSDIDYIIKKTYEDDSADYKIVLKNGKNLTTFEGDSKEYILFKTFSTHNVEIKTE
jgi:hypothetical protein